MSDALNEIWKEEKFDQLYSDYLYKLLVYIETESLQKEISFYAALLQIAKAKPTPYLIDKKIAQMKALKKGNPNEWACLSKETTLQNNPELKAIFEKVKNNLR